MRLRQLNETPVLKDVTDYFYGIDVRPKINDGWMHDSYNMTSDNLPVLSSMVLYEAKDRLYQEKIHAFETGFYFNNIYHWIKDNKFYAKYGRYNTDNVYSFDLKKLSESESKKRQVVTMGRYMIIFPDNFYIEEGLADYGFFDFINEVPEGEDLIVTPCTAEGDSIAISYTQASKPSDPANGAYWVDTSNGGSILKRWNSQTESWDSVPTSYIKFSGTNIGKGFKEGMTFNFSDKAVNRNNVIYTSPNGTEITWNTFDAFTEIWEKPAVVYKCSKNYIITEGILKYSRYTVKDAFFQNLVPKFDYVIECENRLWGCYNGNRQVQARDKRHELLGYGTGWNAENNIYASALGDFKTWYNYSGTTLDSYSVTLGKDGPFTGAINYNGKPVFMKENTIIHVYGNYPANFQLTVKDAPGVARGCYKTLKTTDGKAFYQGYSGVMKYDGTYPVNISEPIGTLKANSTNFAEAYNGKYVISVSSDNADEKNRMVYIYDSKRNVWNRLRLPEFERVSTFANANNNIVASPEGNGDTTYELFKDREFAHEEYPLNWMVETGELALKSASGGTFLETKKYISQIIVRMNIPDDEAVYFYFMYDDSGEWEHVYTADGGRLKSYTIPIRPRRCDHLRMKMTGRGRADIYSIVRRIEVGSER